MTKELKINWHDGDSALASLESCWKKLEEKSNASAFTSWSWLNAWWNNYSEGKSLHILLVEIDDSVELLLPFQVRRKRILGLIPVDHWYNLGSKSSAGCDYLGGIFPNSLQLSITEFDTIVTAIRKKRRFLSFLHFNELGRFSFPQKHEFFNFIASNSHVIREEPTFCPTIQLPDSWDDFLASLSRNFRSQIRRDIKKFQENNELTIGVHTSPEQLQEKVAELKRLNTQRISQLGKTSSFESKQLANFLDEATQELAKTQHCTFYQLYHNEKSVGIILLINDTRTQYYYLGGFDQEYKKFSPINILFVHAIQDAIANKYQEFNLLKGKEPYKYRWKAVDDINDNLTIIDGGIPQLSLYYIELFFYRLNRKTKHLWGRHIKNEP